MNVNDRILVEWLLDDETIWWPAWIVSKTPGEDSYTVHYKARPPEYLTITSYEHIFRTKPTRTRPGTLYDIVSEDNFNWVYNTVENKQKILDKKEQGEETEDTDSVTTEEKKPRSRRVRNTSDSESDRITDEEEEYYHDTDSFIASEDEDEDDEGASQARVLPLNDEDASMDEAEETSEVDEKKVQRSDRKAWETIRPPPQSRDRSKHSDTISKTDLWCSLCPSTTEAAAATTTSSGSEGPCGRYVPLFEFSEYMRAIKDHRIRFCDNHDNIHRSFLWCCACNAYKSEDSFSAVQRAVLDHRGRRCLVHPGYNDTAQLDPHVLFPK